MGRSLAKQLDVGGGYPALADLAAVELDGEAEAVADDVDDLSRAGVVVVGQLGVMAVPVERGARLLHSDEVADGGSGAREPVRDPGFVARSQFVPRLVSLLQDFLRHALLVGDRLLESLAKRGVVEGLGDGVDVAARLSTEGNAVGRRVSQQRFVWRDAVDPGCYRDRVVPSTGPRMAQLGQGLLKPPPRRSTTPCARG